MRKGIIYLLTVCFITSCIHNELDNMDSASKHSGINSFTVKNFSDYKGTDSLNIISKMQSDHDLMLIKHIDVIDGNYVLTLTPSCAMELGIDSEAYEKYSAIVKSLNE